MQNFQTLYKELAKKITDNISEVRWVDLWNSQVYHLEEEHPFPTPAVFLAFRSQSMENRGEKTQEVDMQIDVFLFYETFLDTFKDAYNQKDALAFLDLMDNLNKVLHGSSGVNYSSMDRIAFSPVDTGGAGNLWSITYRAALLDYSAARVYEEIEVDGVIVERGTGVRVRPDLENGYTIPD